MIKRLLRRYLPAALSLLATATAKAANIGGNLPINIPVTAMVPSIQGIGGGMAVIGLTLTGVMLSGRFSDWPHLGTATAGSLIAAAVMTLAPQLLASVGINAIIV